MFAFSDKNDSRRKARATLLRVDINERVRIDVIERDTVRVGVQVAVGATEMSD